MNIAIIGASKNKEKFGNKAVRAYHEAGWQVFPVNPKEKEIEGLPCYPSVVDIHDKLDYVSLYLPPKVSLKLVDDFVAVGVSKVYVNPGAESDELISALKNAGLEPLMVCSILSLGVDPVNL